VTNKLSPALALLLLLALASPHLQATDDPAAATGTASPDNTSDWAEHTVTNAAPIAPPSAAAAAAKANHEAAMKSMLAKMATRMMETQQQTPDPQIKAIIDANHLDDTTGLAALTPRQTIDKIKVTAIALFQVSKNDPLAVQLLKEFHITYTPGPAKSAPPPTPPPIPETTTIPPVTN
jgi:hypothetical protein